MKEVLSEFLNSPSGQALVVLLAAAFADFLTGSFAAIRDGTFALDSVAAWVRKHVAGRVLPIGVLLALGYFGGPGVAQLFTAGAIAAAAAYVAETAASILGNLNPPKESDVKSGTAVNPIPKD